VAADAVVVLPELLAVGDLAPELGIRIELLPLVSLRQGGAGVEGQGEEEQQEEHGAAVEDVPRH
jgi:hypothetical protein